MRAFFFCGVSARITLLFLFGMLFLLVELFELFVLVFSEFDFCFMICDFYMVSLMLFLVVMGFYYFISASRALSLRLGARLAFVLILVLWFLIWYLVEFIVIGDVTMFLLTNLSRGEV